MESGDGNNNADKPERAELDRCLSSKAVNGVVIADGSGVTEGKEVWHLKREAVNNRVAIADGCFRTYKRRKHVKMSCSESKVQEDGRQCVEAASHLSDQVSCTPFAACVPVMVLCCHLSICIKRFVCYVQCYFLTFCGIVRHKLLDF